MFMRGLGYHILPVYEKEGNDHKGPVLFTRSNKSFIAPDLMAFNDTENMWIEVKYKDGFSLHRKTNRMVTGIDLHHYQHYQEVQELVDWPLYIFFLMRGNATKDSPSSNPGLYGHEIKHLAKHENHRSGEYGKGGMVYWAESSLMRLAHYDNETITR